MEQFKLSTGRIYPVVGYGTYKATTGEEQAALEAAIRTGYRYFDTASFYNNEEELGKAILESGIPREEFQIATKVFKTEMGYENTLEACKRSLKRLKIEHLDLYLIHWPKADVNDGQWEVLLADTWRALEELQNSGLVMDIGVCNCLPHHLEVIRKNGNKMPVVNQLEFHPGYVQPEAYEYCLKEGILVQAWSPLGRMRVLKDELLVEIAQKYQVSTPQLCLRFCYQMQVMALPKASASERMKENMDIFGFEIEETDMIRMREMSQTGWSGEHPDRERVYL